MILKRKLGQIVKIDLQNGYFVYACDLGHNVVAIYDSLTKSDELSVEEITSKPLLFIKSVADSEFQKWKPAGRLDLKSESNPTSVLPDTFRQSVIDPSMIFIVDAMGNERTGSFEEAQQLEPSFGLPGHQVEQCIRDHYAKKTNWIVELNRLKPLSSPHYRPTEKYESQPGAIKQIPLGDGTFVYLRELPDTLIAIYDSRTTHTVPPQNVITLPVLFTVSISLSARLGWKTMDFAPLGENEHPLPERYAIEGMSGNEIYIYAPGFSKHSGTIKEIEWLEPAVMWDNYQVENRLRAHYKGKPWVFVPNDCFSLPCSILIENAHQPEINTNNFDNDGTYNLLAQLKEVDSLQPIYDLVNNILNGRAKSRDYYIDVDEAQQVIVGGEIITLIKGKPASYVPAVLLNWHKKHNFSIESDFMPRLIQSIRMTHEKSELRELWTEGGEDWNGFINWNKSVLDLINRLDSIG